MAVKTDREYRSFALENIETKSENEEYIVEGYAALFDAPYVLFTDEEGRDYNEDISSKAFANADMSDIVFLYNHEGMVYARLKNGTLEVTPDEKGLHIRANLGSTKASREVFDAIKTGLVDQMSWAFTIDADEYDKKTRTRTITSVRKVYDVSAVSIPANPATSISARDYFNGVIEAEQAERLEKEHKQKLLNLKLKMEA